MQSSEDTGPEDEETSSSGDEDAVCGDADAEPGRDRVSIWPMIATMDYLIRDLARLSPMSAYLLRMARQNLLDEHLGALRPRKSNGPAEQDG